ncbi:MAG: type IV pilus assembly protein PilM [Candidatus Doudnabacteria bacterium]|nr:type IV pilus assembly protein PilM [Candidatus Doudnabacteria bacterium]
MFPFSSKPILGIDISDNSIELVCLQSKKNNIVLKNYGRVKQAKGIVEDGKILDKAALAANLKTLIQTIDSLDVSQCRAVVSLPESRVFTRIFSLPANLNKDQLKNIILDEAENIIPLRRDEIFFDFTFLDGKNDGQEIFYASVRKNIVKDYIRVLRDVGIQLSVLDMESISLFRALVRECGTTEAVLLADCGARTTIISIFDRYGIRFSANIPIAGNKFTGDISAQLNISDQDAEKLKQKTGFKKTNEQEKNIALILEKSWQPIIDEITASLRYYKEQSGRDVKKIILAGGSSLLPELEKFLTEKLGLDVKIGDPWQGISVDKEIKRKLKKQAILYATVVGLALREIMDNPCLRVNLLPSGKELEAISRRETLPGLPKVNLIRPGILTGTASGIGKKIKEKIKKLSFFSSAESAPSNAEGLGMTSLTGGKTFLKNKTVKAAMLSLGIIIIWVGIGYGWYYYGKTPHYAGPIVSETAPSKDKAILPYSVNLDFVIQIDPQSIKLGHLLEKEIAQTEIFKSSGKQLIEQIATGTVTIFNQTNKPVTLIPTTRLLSREQALFRLKDWVKAPALGNIEAEIYADQPGAVGNIPPSTFVFLGLPESSRKIIFAESSHPISGGIKELPLVAEGDLVKPKEELSKKISKETFLSFVESDLRKDEVLMPELLGKEDTSFTASAVAGEEKAEFEAVLKTKIKVLVLNKAAVVEYAKKQLGDELGNPFAAEKYKLINLEYDLKEFNISGNVALIRVKAEFEARE